MTGFKGPDGQEDMPYLLTPGPVTTPRSIKLALLADFSSDDAEFHSAIVAIRRDLKKLVCADESYDCVLLPWPRAFALECVLGSLCPSKRKKTLVVSNGSDAEQVSALLQQLGKHAVPLTYRETSRAKSADVAKVLSGDRSMSHVWVAHCESSTGLLNPAADVAREVKTSGRVSIVDASMTLGAEPINVLNDAIDVLLSSSEAALESLPGISIVIARRDILEAAKGQSHSPALDLHARWKAMDQPQHSDLPTHATLALREALRELDLEGGVANRSARYQQITRAVRERLQALGFTMLLNDQLASHLVQCVLAPKHGAFNFQRFSELLYARGFVVARGTLAKQKSFRVGCMGQINDKVIMHLAIALEEVLKEMDVRSFSSVSP
jgi:2-aminoethylphosphonate-pyruvate transaminase